MNQNASLSLPTYVSGDLPSSIPLRAAVALASTLLIAACAHVAVPLPFTPVPLTLQPLAVLCVGLLLGPVDGALALLAYLAEGAAGLPVFAPTGPGGLVQLLGPTGGYLLSYPLVAASAGLLVRRLAWLPKFAAAMCAALVASVVLFAAGSFWLHALAGRPAGQVWVAAVLPFLPGAIIHVLIAAGVYRAAARS